MSFNEVRTRIAPSPTGSLHLGTVRTALYNVLFAKANKGKFFFRLEDTDKERSKQEFTDEIINGFNWLDISWDKCDVIGSDEKGIVLQSQREKIHHNYIEKLISQNKAYKCFATPDELEQMRKEQRAQKLAEGYDNRGRKLSKEEQDKLSEEGKKYVIRLNLGKERDICWNDLIRGEMKVNTKDLGGDPVIQKFNGQVLYNFAVVVDDAEMKLTHIFRGEDHLTNTAKQITIYEALGFAIPSFGHLPLIFTKDKQKLSKRKHGDIAGIDKYRNEGYLAKALNNYLVSTSFTASNAKEGSEAEVYTINELAQNFAVSGFSKSPAIYDIQKLNWFNREYISKLNQQELMQELNKYIKYDLNKYSNEQIEQIIDAVKTSISKFDEINEQINYFFEEFSIEDKLQKFINEGQEVLAKFAALLSSSEIDFDDAVKIKAQIDAIGEELGLKAKQLYFPIRIALSGTNRGPDLGLITSILGKELSIKRIDAMISAQKL